MSSFASSEFKRSERSLNAGKAWELMMQTPRHYKNDHTFTDWSGNKFVNCPILGINLSDI